MKNHSSLLFLTSVDSKGKNKYKFNKALNTDDQLFLISHFFFIKIQTYYTRNENNFPPA